MLSSFNKFMSKFVEVNDNDNNNEDVSVLELQSNPLEYNSNPKLCGSFNCGGFCSANFNLVPSLEIRQ